MILVHHLRVGRSVFTVWLLEELGLEYELKIYVRDENGRAQDDLKQAHPLGKSPVIEDQGMVIAESGAIASYLLDTYDTDNLLGAPDDPAGRVAWTQWLHYAEGSMFAPLLIKLLLSRDPSANAPRMQGFADKDLALHLAYVRDQLGEKTFLLGDRFTAPDIGVSFMLNMAKQLGGLDEDDPLVGYLGRTMSRPAFKRAWERTGG